MKDSKRKLDHVVKQMMKFTTELGKKEDKKEADAMQGRKDKAAAHESPEEGFQTGGGHHLKDGDMAMKYQGGMSEDEKLTKEPAKKDPNRIKDPSTSGGKYAEWNKGVAERRSATKKAVGAKAKSKKK